MNYEAAYKDLTRKLKVLVAYCRDHEAHRSKGETPETIAPRIEELMKKAEAKL